MPHDNLAREDCWRFNAERRYGYRLTSRPAPACWPATLDSVTGDAGSSRQLSDPSSTRQRTGPGPPGVSAEVSPTSHFHTSLLQKACSAEFCPRRRGEGWSAGGMQRSQDGSGRHRRGAGVAWIHEAFLPVMRASARDEMWRISLTSRSSSRLFSIHSLQRTSSSAVRFKLTVFPRTLRVQWW